MRIETILCPVDLSPKSKLAVKAALRLAKLDGAKVLILNIQEDFLSKKDMVMLRVSEKLFAEKQKQVAIDAQEKIQKLIKSAGGAGDTEIEILLRQGKPYAEIVETASKFDADLIVMATDGRSGIVENVAGSNAERVLHAAKCSVLAVRE